MTPELEIRQREQLNEYSRRMRELTLQNEADQKHYVVAIAEVEALLKHEATLKGLDRQKEIADRQKEIAEKIRQILEAFPSAPLFKAEGLEFDAAERRLESGRAEVARVMETLWAKAAPHALEFDLTSPDANSRSIAPRPARSHKRLHGGEDIFFRARSSVAGYLSAFNLGTSGDTLLIYPNKWQLEGRIAARTFLDIPDNRDYEIGKIPDAPFGLEVMRAFVTPDRLGSYVPVTFGESGYAHWRGKEAVDILRQLAARLEQVPKCTWAMGAMSFEVVPIRREFAHGA